jgi:photosystem II stability/assembly factor-like uncharacterized protein
MKKLLLFIVSVFAISSVNAQLWMKDINTENQNFYDIKNAFNNYWNGKTIEKGKGYKPFKRWEWYWEQRVGPDGSFPESDILFTELKKYNDKLALNKTNSSYSNANWTFMGPNTSAGGYSGIGRLNCIGFHPTIANTFWVGAPAGGLWKTTDGGTTWSTNTDNLPVLGISDIAINPSNPNIIYIATGDGDNTVNMGDTKSVGVLKSTDGGATWSTTGLNLSLSSKIIIRRLIINPTNPLILIAATSNGIYRTADGGTSWTQQKTGWFIDVEYKPSDPNYAYASTFDFNGNSQIYTSTDSGVTWNQVTSFSGIIRIDIAVTANSPNLVDALCVDSQSGLYGLYNSKNSGATFTQYFNANCTNNFLNFSFDASGCGGQGFYDLAYTINPSDSNEIWMGGINTWRSIDGGSNWSLNNVWSAFETSSVPEVHADKHFIAFHPLNNSLIYECNDGGLYVTNNSGTNWNDITNGMGISQLYRIGTNAQLSNDVICGLQDNGAKELLNGTWYDQTGGDGMECIIDYTNGNIKYATYVYGEISKTVDGGLNWSVILQNNGTAGTADEEGAWVTPYIMHPTNHNVLTVGKSQVYQTTNGGSTWSQLGTIPGITGNIIAMAYAPSSPTTIYVATNYQLFKTANNGGTWNLINTSTEAITYIAVSPTNPQYVYLTHSGYTNGYKVSKSPDGGTTWNNYSGTALPNVPVNCIVYQNGTNEGLYIGTDLGVYYKNATMSDWVSYNTSLPNVVVNELEISYNDGKLWAATFGRGLWKSDLYISTSVSNNTIENNNINLYPNPNNGLFEIKFNGINVKSNSISIQVTDIFGRVVYQTSNQTISKSPISIDLTNQSNGVYYVIINDGNKPCVKKIVLNK